MLNTVVLFTPPNHEIASSTACGHLRVSDWDPKLLIPFTQSLNNSSFWAPPFPVLHHVIVWVYKIWDVNLKQNFTLYPKKWVSIAKKDEHFAFCWKNDFWPPSTRPTSGRCQKNCRLKFQASKTFLSPKFSNSYDFFIGCSFFARAAFI
jgi:hypothetical protein